MTTQPLQAVLDPQAAQLMFATLSHPAGASAQDITASRQEALAFLAELAPRDRLQSALAVRVIGLHHATMHHLAQAAQGEIPDDLALRHAGRATTASRMMDRAMAALAGRQMMMPMRAVAVPAGIVAAPAVKVAPADAAPAEAPMAAAVDPQVEPAVTRPPEPQAVVRQAPSAAPGALAYRQTRRQELEERAARGQALTAAQQEWLRREKARQAEGAVPALAA